MSNSLLKKNLYIVDPLPKNRYNNPYCIYYTMTKHISLDKDFIKIYSLNSITVQKYSEFSSEYKFMYDLS